MEKNYRSKYVFLAIGICIAVSAPFLLIFASQTVADIAHKKGFAQVFVPSENYTVYGVGLLLLVIAAILISILDIRKLSIILSIACLCLSVLPFWAASQSFKLVSENLLTYRTLFSKHELSYTWSDVERVIYYNGKQRDYPEYEFFLRTEIN